jgi:ABC-2 type transport system ATP-binding protein
MTNYVIETASLTKDHISHMLRKRFRAIDGVNLKVAANETYGLLGLNGAGKTTTLKLLLGLLRPTSGTASVLGYKAGAAEALSAIGFLPESPYFYSHLTAREFLDLAGKLFGLSAKERADRVKELFELTSLTEASSRQIRKFSKGMMQRLGIAQSLINDPQVIFWDEPTSGLDPIGRRDVREILLKLKSQGKTIFFNSHLLPDVNEVCDRVGILHRGKLIAEESIATISGGTDYQKLETYFLETVRQAEKQNLASNKAEGIAQ